MSEFEIHLLNDSWNESASHLRAQSGIHSESHSQSDSVSESRIDLWNDSPNVGAVGDPVSVRRSGPRSFSNITRGSHGRQTAVRDVDDAVRLCETAEVGGRGRVEMERITADAPIWATELALRWTARGLSPTL